MPRLTKLEVKDTANSSSQLSIEEVHHNREGMHHNREDVHLNREDAVNMEDSLLMAKEEVANLVVEADILNNLEDALLNKDMVNTEAVLLNKDMVNAEAALLSMVGVLLNIEGVVLNTEAANNMVATLLNMEAVMEVAAANNAEDTGVVSVEDTAASNHPVITVDNV
jgi:hypothetical protein